MGRTDASNGFDLYYWPSNWDGEYTLILWGRFRGDVIRSQIDHGGVQGEGKVYRAARARTGVPRAIPLACFAGEGAGGEGVRAAVDFHRNRYAKPSRVAQMERMTFKSASATESLMPLCGTTPYENPSTGVAHQGRRYNGWRIWRWEWVFFESGPSCGEGHGPGGRVPNRLAASAHRTRCPRDRP